MMMGRAWVVVWVAVALGVAAQAGVGLASVFSDHMVLQRGREIPVWGTADGGEKVTVALWADGAVNKAPALAEKAATAGADGRWRVALPAMEAGGPYALTASGRSTATASDVLIGEVWLASGQSNMEWRLRQTTNAAAEAAAATYPLIRSFEAKHTSADAVQADVAGYWQVCSPATAGGFSAVAYHFAREMHEHLKVPVGILHVSWGGSTAEAWMSREALVAKPDYAPMVWAWEGYWREGYPAQMKEYETVAVPAWEKAAAEAKAAGKPEPRKPRAPRAPEYNFTGATRLWNGMMAPLAGYGIRGAIWYQGESNIDRAAQYRTLLPDMIALWRERWGQGDFPFMQVQLAGFLGRATEGGPPVDSDYADLREAQAKVLDATPNTALATAVDIGEARSIHPMDKRPVGARLARCARALAYGEDVEWSGPRFAAMEVVGGEARLTFKRVGGGLTVRAPQDPAQAGADGPGEVKGFAIAGADRRFVWATARVENDAVVVSSPLVAAPAAVRYAWGNFPATTLYSKEGLPAIPFRTDDWETPTSRAKIPMPG